MAAQPLHRAVVNIDEALSATDEVVHLYRLASVHTNAPAFSGGVLDAWPAWAVEAFAVLRQEEARVTAWRRSEVSPVEVQSHG